MFQYDLYERHELNVGDRVFYYGMCGFMPMGTIVEKYEERYRTGFNYMVHFDHAPSPKHLNREYVSSSREDGKQWLQLYTEEKYIFLRSLEKAQRPYKQRFGEEYSEAKLAQEKPVRGC